MAAFEFVGLPGAGKSTVFSAMSHLASEEQLPPIRLGALPRLADAIGYFTEVDPEFLDLADRVSRVVAHVREERGEIDPDRLYKLQARELIGRAYAVMEARDGPGVVVLEEGTVHQTWRLNRLLADSPVTDRTLRDLWCATPVADVLVHLEVARSIRHARFATKPKLGPINRELAQIEPSDERWTTAEAQYEEGIARALRRGSRLVSLANGPETSAVETARAVSDLAAIEYRRSC